MYKRMAEAGFLAKEPGMGAADIAKAHGRCLTLPEFTREIVCCVRGRACCHVRVLGVHLCRRKHLYYPSS